MAKAVGNIGGGEHGRLDDAVLLAVVALCHIVKTVASMLFESVSDYGVSGGLGGLRNTRTT